MPPSPGPRSVARRPVLAAAAALLAASATPAAADTARLVTEQRADDAVVRVVVTGPTGATRRLGPFVLPAKPTGLVASPDGRHLVLRNADIGDPLRVLPLDGRPPVAFTVPAGVEVTPDLSTVSWNPEGDAVLVGDALAIGPDGDPEAGATPGRWLALRCAMATATCTELPGPGGAAPGGAAGPAGAGLAAGVPGGTITSSSPLSALRPVFLVDEYAEPSDGWVPARGAIARDLPAIADERRVTATALHAPAPRVLARREGTGRRGLPLTTALVGGPSGVLLTRWTHRVRVQTRKGGREVRVRDVSTGPRLERLAPDGTALAGPRPGAVVARADLRALDGRRARRAFRRFSPALGRPDGGWLGTVGRGRGGVEDEALALATMDERGRGHVVRVGGRGATIERLVRFVPRGRPSDLAGSLRVIGYERATRSAIVSFDWAPPRRSSNARQEPARTAVVRVRLDGRGRPAVLDPDTSAAW